MTPSGDGDNVRAGGGLGGTDVRAKVGDGHCERRSSNGSVRNKPYARVDSLLLFGKFRKSSRYVRLRGIPQRRVVMTDCKSVVIRIILLLLVPNREEGPKPDSGIVRSGLNDGSLLETFAQAQGGGS